MQHIIKVLGLVLLFTACSGKYPKEVQEALDKMSRSNKQKFEKVFDEFKSDKQKLQAAYLIVANINDFGFYKGDVIDRYDVVFDILAQKPSDYRYILPWYSTETNELFDSLEKVIGPFDTRNISFVSDADAMTTHYLITYINQAFEAWQNPWAQDVSFEDFCNYVLPYRSYNEELEVWRPMFLKKYSWIYDSVKPGFDRIDVAKLLNRDTELTYSKGFDRYAIPISPSNQLKAGFGNCSDISNHKAMVMRSFGIPMAIDYIPIWGDDHKLHYWNSIMDKNGNWVNFEEAAKDTNTFVAYKHKLSKVYRKTISKNEKWAKLIEDTGGDIPPFFKNPRNIDVTRQYVAVSDVQLKLSDVPKQYEVLYLCVFNNHGFTAVDFAFIDKETSFATFKNVGRDLLYFPMYFTRGKFIPAYKPFNLTKKGFIRYIEPQAEKQQMILTRKYNMHYRKENWLNCLVGGKFQGANHSDFSDAVTLATISKVPSQHFVNVSVNSGRAFKYYRFLFSDKELEIVYDGDGASIAEIEFVDSRGNVLQGKPIGTLGRKYNTYLPELAFDGNVLTFFEDAREHETGKWVGLELDSPKALSKIRYSTRNDQNNVQPGDTYELLYWDNGNFYSAGQKQAVDTLVYFDAAPKGTVYWLRDLTQGTEERLFTYENNKQVWW
ncbi:MAG: hypothetical protein JXA77_00380 [Bacteroidales bacterium]|nr:hypothetical protein [Bacteroidales bacterium]MBN2817629.1 hypothetical protein [Bacteroidales bacterium]